MAARGIVCYRMQQARAALDNATGLARIGALASPALASPALEAAQRPGRSERGCAYSAGGSDQRSGFGSSGSGELSRRQQQAKAGLGSFQDGRHEHELEPRGSAQSGGPDVMFHTNFPEPGLYKAWGQFKHRGQIITARSSRQMPLEYRFEGPSV